MPNAVPPPPSRIALVLGGGGLKGFAHIGVLRALQERGIKPSVFAGTSIGALIAAAHATGTGVTELTERAVSLRRGDLFRLNHMGMLLERMRSRSIYLEEPLRSLTRAVVPHVRFDDIATTLLVNTVDIERGTQVVWGLPGHRDVFLDDAVYASCALPGFFPPGRVDGRVCVDGGVIDNLPVSVVAAQADAIIAVDVGNNDVSRDETVSTSGFASLYMRAATVMMHALQGNPLAQWDGPPMLLVRPRVSQFGWLRFGVTDQLIDLGYRATVEALADFDICARSARGVFPRRVMQVAVDQAKCNGCGLCVAGDPDLMTLDVHGKAHPRRPVVDWSPADGEFVRHCPTGAIHVQRILPLEAAS
jgi:NTE family protein